MRCGGNVGMGDGLCPMGVCHPGVGDATLGCVSFQRGHERHRVSARWLSLLKRMSVPPRCLPRALNVTLVLQCERWRFVRVGLAVPLLGTVAELREMVAREGRIPPEQVTKKMGGEHDTRWGTHGTPRREGH